MSMVKATLPELQFSGLYPRWQRSSVWRVAPRLKGRVRSDLPGPANAACLPSGGLKERTEHLTSSYLLNGVNTGSPARMSLAQSEWRQSHPSSQTPGVISRTAAIRLTGTGETEPATERGIFDNRVKGDRTCGIQSLTEWTC
ncbi:hypothetical protein [Nitrosococcus wardiae]|uniref:Uncharacterized protein n=1 Tax=Nitrosococcus wardiae TaxID=1814290 RepID=A0A4P7BUA5_9GAMM|nr:hypothetical protein [Nitrosococcus wardiae]QBQ53451.1 hypothetical protein E3U44_02245 [Nitrosococcus wardiae]